jgi:TM2 domain-containing membrane protein YozV/ribosomal protein L40E
MSENTTTPRDRDEHYDRRQKNADETYCSSCGAIIKSAAEVCPKCGVRQVTPVANANVGSGVIPSYLVKSRMTAAILAFFLGWIGGHKFYMGQVGLGIIYLIFSWTGVPAIIAFVEGILYVTCNSDEEFTLKYVLGK